MKRIFAFLVIISVYLSANYYVFSHVWVLMDKTSVLAKISFLLLTGLLSTSFILFMLLSKRKAPVFISSIFYKVGSGWMIILVYAFILFVLLDVFKIINQSIKILPDRLLTGWTSIGIIIKIIGFLCLYGFGTYLNKKRIFLDLKIQRKLQKPIKIVAISDLHLGYAIGRKELKKWIEKINNEKPDIVLIAGDIVDNNTHPLEYYKLDEYFKKIEAPLGVYTCLGNHEYISKVGNCSRFFEKAGIKLLKDVATLVDNNFYLIGRDDKTNSSRKSVKELIKELDPSKPMILLDHQPYNLEEAKENKIDVQLSGHTHRGQVWPLSMIADAIYEKSHGYIRKGDTHIYVSSGIGIWGGRYRIGTQSEYIVIKLSN